jgi:hypothetical protein
LCNWSLLLCEMRRRLMFDLLIAGYFYYLTTLFNCKGYVASYDRMHVHYERETTRCITR